MTRTRIELKGSIPMSVLMGIAVTSLVNCTGPSAINGLSSGVTTASNQQYIQAQIHLAVANSSGTTIYSDTSPNSSLLLAAGQNYTVNLTVVNAPAGTTYSILPTNIDLVNPTALQPIPLVPGANNSFSVATQGDYTLQLVAVAPGFTSQTKTYQAQVTCASPTFTAASLNASAISVTGANDVYTYSAAGVTSGANGQAPYYCAWDPTGTGIVDTAYVLCSTPITNVYDNYVLTRNVGLVVRDACNTSYAISNSVNLPYTEPALGAGNVFIQGVTSAATGSAATDSRTNNVTYFATNTADNKIVSTQYGKGNFTIFAWQNYAMGSSVNFGVQIKLGGLVESPAIDAATMTGSVSAANATIQSVTYVTDQAGDQEPSESFTSSNCTLTNQNAKVMFVQGQPCSGGTSGDQNNATVEVWGHYSCPNMTGNEGSFDFQGDFDGYFDIADGCSGSGQSGGVPPPGF